MIIRYTPTEMIDPYLSCLDFVPPSDTTIDLIESFVAAGGIYYGLVWEPLLGIGASLTTIFDSMEN